MLFMSDWVGWSWETVAYVAASTTAVYCSALLAIRVAGQSNRRSTVGLRHRHNNRARQSHLLHRG